MMCLPRRGTWIAALALVFLGASVATAQSFPRLLEDIRMTVADGREVVRFQFSQPFEAEPKQEHEAGSFRLNFFGTGSPVPVRSFKVNDSQYVREIRVQQNQYSTTVTFLLREGAKGLKNRLAFSRNGKLFQVALDTSQPQAAPPSGGPSDKELLVEMTDKIAGKTAPAEQPAAKSPAKGAATGGQQAAAATGALGKFEGVEWIPAMVTLVFTLAIFIGALYGVMFLYNRYVATRISRAGNSQMIRQVASFHIAPKQRVVILEIQGERIACGITPSQITFLTKLESPSRGVVGRKAAPRGTPPAPAAERSAEAAAPARAGKQADSNDPMRQFAETLKEKVGAMKRLK